MHERTLKPAHFDVGIAAELAAVRKQAAEWEAKASSQQEALRKQQLAHTEHVEHLCQQHGMALAIQAKESKLAAQEAVAWLKKDLKVRSWFLRDRLNGSLLTNHHRV